MNILVISPYFRPMVGGVETHLDDLCAFLNRQKYQVFVRTYQAFGVKNRGLSDEKSTNINIHRLWWPDFNLIFKLESYPVLKFIYLFPPLFIDCLLFLIRENKSVRVIQAHGFIAGLIAIILGKTFHKRIVINTHVGFKLKNGFTTQIIKWTLLSCDQILVLTEGIKKSLLNLGLSQDKILVYHYWVNQKEFNILPNVKKRLNWQDKQVVLFVGRLIEVKGIRIIFDLAKKLKDCTFVIIGSGPLSEEIEQESEKYSNSLFIGKVKNQDLPLYYNKASLLLIPSKVIQQEYEEGIPRVMIEALSCGLPVIATKSGGIPDIYSTEMGLLVDDNLGSITKAIKTILSKEIKRSVIRKYAIKMFSINNANLIKDSLQAH